MFLILIITLVICVDTKTTVDELRKKILNVDNSQFDPKDLEMIKTGDNWVKRFAGEHEDNAEDAVNHLARALKWRKEYKISELSDKWFPKELFQIGLIFPYGKDVNGNQIFILRVSVVKSFSEEWNQVIKKFIAYRCEVASRDKLRVLLIMDFLNISYETINTYILKFIALDLDENYPALVKKALLINVNTLISLPIKAIIALLPKQHQDLVQIIDGNELSKWVANDNLPQVIGGSGQNDFRTVPSEAPTAQEFSKSQNMNSGDTEVFLKYIEKYLK